MKFLFLLFVLILNLKTSYADIFGKDDRIDVADASLTVQAASSAVAVGVLNSLWEPSIENALSIYADSMSDYLCKDERFSDQPSISYACTGFLVGPDLLVTAGHCMTNAKSEIFHETKMYCEVYTWFFGFNRGTDISKVSPDEVYKCKEILYAVYDEDPNGKDFALIKLDRPVNGVTPLKFSDSPITKNMNVSILGHPMGAPIKYAGNAKIIFHKDKDNSFFTNLDAFGGNSGSPVFNKNMEVSGMLVGGLPNSSTYYDSKSKCNRYNFCSENGLNCKNMDTKRKIPAGLPNAFSEVQKLGQYLPLIEVFKTFRK